MEVFCLSKLKLSSIVVALFILIISFSVIPVNADTNNISINISELDMTIDVPYGTDIITNSVKKNDELFKNGTFDYIESMTQMRKDSAVLYGKNLKDNYEIEIINTLNENNIKNLTKLSPKKQNKLLKKYSKEPDIVESDIYDNGKLVFFTYSRTFNDGTNRIFYSDYFTIYNKNNISIRIISHNDNLTKGELDILKTMADSIQFPVKKKITFSNVLHSKMFITFLILPLAYFLIFIYRKNENSINNFALMIVSKIPAKENKSSNPITYTSEDSNSSLDDKDYDNYEDIDLDEAIATFDESNKQ